MVFRDRRTLLVERATLAAYLIGCVSVALHPPSSRDRRDCPTCEEERGSPSISVLCLDARCLDPEHHHHRNGPSRSHDHDAESCTTCRAAASAADIPSPILIDLHARGVEGLPETIFGAPPARTALPRSRSPPLA